MLKGFVLYTEEEVKTLLRDVDKLIAIAADGRFNSETEPRETCKILHSDLKDIKLHIENGYDRFANKKEPHTHYYDAHFM